MEEKKGANKKPSSIKINKTSSKSKSSMQNERSIIKPKSRTANNIGKSRTPRNEENIPSYLPKNQSKTQNSTPSVFETYLNDPECIQIREKLFANSDMSTIASGNINKVLIHLKEFSTFSASNRDYESAQKADFFYDIIKQEVCIHRPEAVNYEELDVAFEKERNELIQRLDLETDEFDKDTQTKRDIFESKLEKDMNSFESVWRDEMPRKYRKPSPGLLLLYDKEKRMAKSGDFEGAKLIKAETDKLEAQELQRAQAQLNYDYQIAKKKVMEKQEQERKLFNDTRDHLKAIIFSKHQAGLDALTNRHHVILIKQSQNQSSIKDQPISPIPPPSCAQTNQGVSSPPPDRVLPPLIPPNDQRMISINEKENQKKKQRIRQIKDYFDHKNDSTRQSITPGSLANQDDIQQIVLSFDNELKRENQSKKPDKQVKKSNQKPKELKHNEKTPLIEQVINEQNKSNIEDLEQVDSNTQTEVQNSNEKAVSNQNMTNSEFKDPVEPKKPDLENIVDSIDPPKQNNDENALFITKSTTQDPNE